MECCNAYYFANKMNQEPNCGQNYSEYFSRPEVLEEIRENLACLIQQESCDLDSIILRLRNVSLPPQDQQGAQPTDMIWRRVEEMMESAQEQLKQRSNNLTSVAALAIRMIDYISQQSASYYHSVQHYQIEVDRLQNTIDELMNRNTIIQSDVEIFREQLEAARNELQEITEDKEEIGEIQQSNVIESKIENLESELERMTAQITFYKSSVFSRTALKCNDQDSNKDMIHAKSLIVLNQKNGKRYVSKDEEEISFSEQVEKNRELKLENERLKNEIEGYRKSMLFFKKGNKDEARDLLCPEMEEGTPKNKQLLRVRTSSKNFIENSSCGSSDFGFSDFFKLFKAKREERLEKLMKEPEQQRSLVKLFNQPSQQSLQICAKEEDGNELLQKPRNLSSEWSRDSFSIFHQQTYEIPQLIFLTQQSEQNENDKADFFNAKPTSISQNKETQSSSKADYNPNTIKITINKPYESLGINTSRDNHPTHKPSFLQTLTHNTFISTLKGFIISNRLQRSRKAANSGTSTILI